MGSIGAGGAGRRGGSPGASADVWAGASDGDRDGGVEEPAADADAGVPAGAAWAPAGAPWAGMLGYAVMVAAPAIAERRGVLAAAEIGLGGGALGAAARGFLWGVAVNAAFLAAWRLAGGIPWIGFQQRPDFGALVTPGALATALGDWARQAQGSGS